ncbi:hypothetical protein AB0I95_30920, partial [Micromonospora sp. NPDC049751]|uniref:hypothetical protein n=1 Tax=Micromonospora sp. NPDC049751 TaxID=3154837 RepID=UPI0033D06056
ASAATLPPLASAATLPPLASAATLPPLASAASLGPRSLRPLVPAARGPVMRADRSRALH